MSVAIMNLPETPSLIPRIAPLAAAVVAWLLVLMLGWWFVNTSGAQEVAQLQIDGDFRRVSAAQVRNAADLHLVQGFVELQLEQVKADIEALPWVARARVERAWPSGLRIRVWERQPLARWGDAALLDTEARVFVPAADERPPDLPQLHGAAGRQREVLDAYTRLTGQLADTPFAPTGLTMDARGEWTATTLSGIGLRLGRTLDDERLALLRGQVLEALRERMHEADYVDLRYTNGFAVGWKEKAAPTTGEGHG